MLRRLGLVAALLTALALATPTAPASAAADRDCGDFSSQRDAQIFFLNAGGPSSDPHRLDSDGDGIACETNPAPYYYGTTPPGGGGGGGGNPEPAPQVVQSSVRVTVSPAKPIAGESYRVTVTVKPAISRDVVVQRKVDGRWRFFGSGTTGDNGVTHGTFKAPKAATTFRAVVASVKKGTKKYTAATSPAQTLKVQRQQVVLAFSDRTLAEGDRVTATVRATPVRAGRPVVLQQRSGGAWRTVKTGTFDKRGRVSFSLTPALGQGAFRAVALRHRGAAPQDSRTVTVTVSDVTAPPAPFDLVATPGDATVSLSWSRTTVSDFSHDEVWMRTDTTGWTLVDETQGTSMVVEGLTNGVAYSFAVRSLDVSGNESAAVVASATPTAPIIEMRRVG